MLPVAVRNPLIGLVSVGILFNASPLQAQLEEVLVTARRQVENLQDTPVAVTAIGEAALEAAGISNLADVRELVPNLQIVNSAGKNQSIYVRGIGQRSQRADLDPGVGQYLNGIFIPRTDAPLLDAVDVANIQVLRGPQGTLFGKNNTGGAMLVTTRAPDPDEAELKLSGKVGSFGRQDLRLGGNLPLVGGRSALRFNLLSKQLEGFIDNSDGTRLGDEDRLAATARLSWDIGDISNLDVFAFWSKMDERSAGMTCRLLTTDALLMSSAIFPGQNQTVSTADRCRQSEAMAKDYKTIMNGDETKVAMESTMLALTFKTALGPVDVESISAWSHQYDLVRINDQDGIDYNVVVQSGSLLYDRIAASGLPGNKEDRNQFSQELKFSGTAIDERLNYTLGVFLALEEIDDSPRARALGPSGVFGLTTGDVAALLGGPAIPIPGVVPVALTADTYSDLRNTSAALFGQVNFDVAQWWQLTLGVRETVEEKRRETREYKLDMNAYAALLNQRLSERGSLAQTQPGPMEGVFTPVPEADFHLIGPRPPTLVYLPDTVNTGGERRFKQLTPTFTNTFIATDTLLSYLNLESAMSYITASRGFKAGGLDLRGATIQPFDAEIVDNYELGFKVDAADSRLRVNGAIYRMEYTDIQVSVSEAAGLTPLVYLTNAGEAIIEGVELEITLALSQWLFNLSGGLTDADYIDYTVGTTSGDVDRSDEPFPMVPKYTLGVSLQRDIDTSFGTLSPRISGYWRDELYTSQDADGPLFKDVTLPSQLVWNFRFAWKHPNNNGGVTLFVNNLTDEFYYGGGLALPSSYGAAVHALAPPRSYGLEFNWRL